MGLHRATQLKCFLKACNNGLDTLRDHAVAGSSTQTLFAPAWHCLRRVGNGNLHHVLIALSLGEQVAEARYLPLSVRECLVAPQRPVYRWRSSGRRVWCRWCRWWAGRPELEEVTWLAAAAPPRVAVQAPVQVAIIVAHRGTGFLLF